MLKEEKAIFTDRKDFVFLEQRIDVSNIGEAEKFIGFLSVIPQRNSFVF